MTTAAGFFPRSSRRGGRCVTQENKGLKPAGSHWFLCMI